MRWLIGMSAAAAATLALGAPDAQACSPSDPELVRTFPAEGGVLPRGAALLLHGTVLMPDRLAVTIDGDPAELVLLPDHSNGYTFVGWDWAYETMAVQVEPTPRVGSTVVVTGDPCLQWEGQSFCDEVELVYTVGEADELAPDGPTELWYDVYDHGHQAMTHGHCGSISAQLEITIHTELERERLEYPLEYHLHRRPRDASGPWALVEHDWLLDAEAHDPSPRWLYPLEDVAELLPLAEAYCLRLRTLDASGNLGGQLEVCPPCHDQRGPGEEGGFVEWPDGAPEYDDESLYPDGYCPLAVASEDTGGTTGTEEEPAGSTSDGEEPEPGSSSSGAPSADGVTARGCACAATPTGGPWASLGGLLGLVLLGLRRGSAGPQRDR